MKKLIIIAFCFTTLTVFGKINDTVRIFSSEDEERIEKSIKKLEVEKNVKVDLNTIIGRESFQLENPEKTIIITYQKIGEGLVITEIKFTEDLKMGERAQDIDIILDALKEKMFEKNYVEYTEELLENLEKIIPNDEIIVEENFHETPQKERKGFFKRIFSKNP